MQVIQPQRVQVALGIERQRAIELQRVGIVQPQTAQLEGATLRAGLQAKLHRMLRQFGVERAQQQFATLQAGIQIDHAPVRWWCRA